MNKIKNRPMLAASQAVYLAAEGKLGEALTNSDGYKTELAKGAGKEARNSGVKVHWPDAQGRWVISKNGQALA